MLGGSGWDELSRLKTCKEGNKSKNKCGCGREGRKRDVVVVGEGVEEVDHVSGRGF